MAREDPECYELEGYVQKIKDSWKEKVAAAGSIGEVAALSQDPEEKKRCIGLWNLQQRRRKPVELKLRPWQQEILRLKKEKKTKIIWISDPIGCCGKTQFLHWLMDHDTKSRMTFLLVHSDCSTRDYVPILWNALNSGWTGGILMLTAIRASEENFPYPLLSMVKSGFLAETKYRGRIRAIGRVPITIVFANFPPDPRRFKEVAECDVLHITHDYIKEKSLPEGGRDYSRSV